MAFEGADKKKKSPPVISSMAASISKYQNIYSSMTHNMRTLVSADRLTLPYDMCLCFSPKYRMTNTRRYHTRGSIARIRYLHDFVFVDFFFSSALKIVPLVIRIRIRIVRSLHDDNYIYIFA